VNPSENESKIRQAILEVFPDAVLGSGPADREGRVEVRGGAVSLDRFAEILARTRIRDAARASLLRGMERGTGLRTSVFINKQAALAGRVNFTDEDVILGPITIEISGPGLREKIDEITLHD
jgi:predicted RNA binding protein with dsRBD fold (UPF0201 family)